MDSNNTINLNNDIIDNLRDKFENNIMDTVLSLQVKNKTIRKKF